VVNDFENVAPLDAEIVKKANRDTTKDRSHMVAFNRDMIAAAIQSWSAEGKDVRDAVVLLIDLTDSLGSQLAMLLDPELPKRELAARQPGTVPTLTLVMDRIDAADELCESHAAIAVKLQEQPPDGYFWVCCIAYEGASLTASPLIRTDEGIGNA
jgi:hypothetical protein